MKTIVLMVLSVLYISTIQAQGYTIGNKAISFNLKNIDDNMVSPEQFKDAKGFVVIFTCNHCPFAKAYEDRIIALDKEYKTQGYPVIAINSNDVSIVPEDSFDNMKIRAKEKGFTFPYVFDADQSVANAYGAERTPHVYLLKKINGELIVKYIGAIDNNYQDASAVTEKYLENAIEELLANKEPTVNFTKAIGCSIKRKE
jgi:peroxiredoxin